MTTRTPFTLVRVGLAIAGALYVAFVLVHVLTHAAGDVARAIGGAL